MLRSGPSNQLGLAAGALAATVVLLRRKHKSGPIGVDPGVEPEPEFVAPKGLAPFPLRLRRELRGLAVFFVLSGLALTGFYALI